MPSNDRSHTHLVPPPTDSHSADRTLRLERTGYRRRVAATGRGAEAHPTIKGSKRHRRFIALHSRQTSLRLLWTNGVDAGIVVSDSSPLQHRQHEDLPVAGMSRTCGAREDVDDGVGVYGGTVDLEA